jgi:hypothetical protein
MVISEEVIRCARFVRFVVFLIEYFLIVAGSLRSSSRRAHLRSTERHTHLHLVEARDWTHSGDARTLPDDRESHSSHR